MNRSDKRRIEKKAKHIWELEQKIEEAKKSNSSFVPPLMKELQNYTSKLDLTDMILIDEYIMEYCATET